MTLSIGANGITWQNVADIPKVTHPEAGSLSQTEYERVLILLASLSDSDWQQPTYCTAWRVREMVAHLAGAVAGSGSYAEFIRQNITNPYSKESVEPVDGTNRLQIEERTTKSTAELVAEFRQKGQIAVNNRQKLPWIVRKIHAPMGDTLGLTPIEYLMDTLYPRDQWMHRYDICAATGKEMVITPKHDGRIVALVLRDVHKKLRKQLASRSMLLRLAGAAGGDYYFGRQSTPECTLEMDTFDFNLRASGRITVGQASSRTAVSGDTTVANWFLTNCEVVY
jgi:uncharacterized protein (TIGR03083 family)